MNFPLLGAIFTIASTVVIGILMIVAFVTGYDSAIYILGPIGVGFLLSLPITFIVTKKLSAMTSAPDIAPKTKI